ncbi:unnamed protein product [Penicillium salamii]|uniref:Carrier domain-containing protein n=1 Tax=Penicillium salamii TaxID=1612424 RepID=A0A9W4J4W7_9EURO|nr:unnamed protein product [Penicillium salamii]CAG8224552.1 unnamed protein product [Penicillium salamii]CAG8379868.1 unnamed protein product [Penicillium salamii]CAG8401111.1 unnamed protein product [Penicillium salamii]CAG8884356.1 unnamed protein product [Penicillium salamii]
MSQKERYALASSATEKQSPVTSSKRILQQVYADILQIQLTSSGMEDTFLRLSGDSVQAIHLIRPARKAGLVVQMQEVLGEFSIADQAEKAVAIASSPAVIYEPLSLVEASMRDDVLKLAQEQCSACGTVPD